MSADLSNIKAGDRAKPPRPYYTVEALGSEWKVVAEFTLRHAAIANAKELSRLGIRHHVYLQCRNGQRKHIFVGRSLDSDSPHKDQQNSD